MIETWYAVVSLMLIVYVVLDGRNFGAGILHWYVARTPAERRQVIEAIGPLWTWHEVWLVGFGGTLVVAFPRLMATAFSGYYLALMLILWALILRGMALELGGHIDDRMWQGFWDVIFVFGSLLLAVLFGAAAGNMARGVPVDAHGDFSMAFFTNFGVRGNVGLLDWYTVSIAIFAVVLLTAHGAAYLALKTEGSVHERSQASARRLWAAAVPLFVVISAESWVVRPDLAARALFTPMCWLGMLVVGGATFALFSGLSARRNERVFAGSNLLIVGLLITGAAAIFPVMLYSTLGTQYSLTAYNVAAGTESLRLASIWWPAACALSLAYYVLVSRRYAEKEVPPLSKT